MFSKDKPPTTFNPIKDRPNITAGDYAQGALRKRDGTMVADGDPARLVPTMGMRYNIWQYRIGFMHSSSGGTDKEAHEHPAIFPEALVLDHMKSWSNKGDLVLDPFCGSGTAIKIAEMLKRKSIGIEISPHYCDIAIKRLEKLTSKKAESY